MASARYTHSFSLNEEEENKLQEFIFMKQKEYNTRRFGITDIIREKIKENKALTK
jgi:hypothetical protein